MRTKADNSVATGCFHMKNPFGSKKDPGPFDEKPRNLRLDDKVAVITGAASGIGAATARLFVSQGARVIIADVQAEAGRKLSSELGSSAHFFLCDVTKEADVAAAVDYAVECWGHLDIMFNNAGVPGPLAGLAEINMEDFDQVMAVHIKGAVLGVKHAARVMIPARKGVILFSGSTSANMGGAGPPLHSAANAAVLCIARSAAAELVRHCIRVNAVSSHCVATPMSLATINASLSPKKDITIEQLDKVLSASSELDTLTTEKVASAVMFLASDDAGFISGHNLVLDGGFSVTKPFASSELKATLKKSLAAQRNAEARSPLRSPTRSIEGSGMSKPSIVKEREVADKPSMEEEVKGSYERERDTRKEEREDKERNKREKETNVEDQKVRAREEKTRAKETKALALNGQGPAQDPKSRATKGDIHSLDTEASAKEARIQNENIELPNAGPEPDIPLEYQSRTPVKNISSLFTRGRKNSKKEGQTEGKSNDPAIVEKAHPKRNSDLPKTAASPDITPESRSKQSPVKRISSLLGLGKDSTDEGIKEKKSDDPGQVSTKEKQEAKSADPRQASKKEAHSPGKEDKVQPKSNDSPKTAASSEMTPASQSKQSPVMRSGSLLGKDSKNEDKKESTSDDLGKVSKKEKHERKSADPRNVSQKEANAPAIVEETQLKRKSDSRKIAASPEITPESQSKQSPVTRIGNLLGLGKDSTEGDKKEIKFDDYLRKVSTKEKQEGKSADTRKIYKEEADPPAKEQTPRSKRKDSPKTQASPAINPGPSPGPQPTQSLLQRIGSLLGLGKDSKKETKTVSWGKDTEKEDNTEENLKSLDAGKVSKQEKKEDKSADTVKVATKETKSPSKEEKARAVSKESTKTPATPEISPEPQTKQSPVMTIGNLLSWGADKKKGKSANPEKVFKK